MSWAFYLGAVVFFTLVFAVFYSVAYSVSLGIRDNYRRYYQKADLQWTGPRGAKAPLRMRAAWLLLLSFLTSWTVVHFIIQP